MTQKPAAENGEEYNHVNTVIRRVCSTPHQLAEHDKPNANLDGLRKERIQKSLRFWCEHFAHLLLVYVDITFSCNYCATIPYV